MIAETTSMVDGSALPIDEGAGEAGDDGEVERAAFGLRGALRATADYASGMLAKDRIRCKPGRMTPLPRALIERLAQRDVALLLLASSCGRR